jgi:glycosyltransferase involved in cell wall biosynthesis
MTRRAPPTEGKPFERTAQVDSPAVPQRRVATAAATVESSPRVCIYQRYLPPDPSGAGKQAVTLAKALEEQGIQAMLLGDLRDAGAAFERIDGIRTHWIEPLPENPSYFQLLAYWGRVGVALMRLRASFDVLHVHSAAFEQSGAVPLARMLRKRVLVRSSISGEFQGLGRSRSGRLQRRALAVCDAFVVLSRRLAEEYVESGLPPNRLNLIPNGVDEDRYKPVTAAEKRALRRELNLPEAERIAIFHGVFIERKSIHWLVDSLGPSLERLDLTLLLVGGGARDEAETGYAAGLVQQIASSAYRDRILIRPFDPQVQRYLQAADLYVLPSTSEGLSNALLEAMAVGLVPIVSRTSGSEDVIEDGVSGFLFEPRDASSLLETIERCLDPNRTSLADRSSGALQRVARKYGIRATARQYAATYGRMTA